MGACPGGRGGCCGGRAGSLSVDIAMCDTSDKSHGKDQVLVEGLCVCLWCKGVSAHSPTHWHGAPQELCLSLFWSKTYRKAAAGSWGCIMFLHVVFSLAG